LSEEVASDAVDSFYDNDQTNTDMMALYYLQQAMLIAA